MSFWRFAYWSLKTADWAVITGGTIGLSILGYAMWDYQHQHEKERWDPTPVPEPQKAGRFGNAFPLNENQYKQTAKKQITLEELEWNIKDRENQYQQYIKDNPKS